jgi:hypothetical protein
MSIDDYVSKGIAKINDIISYEGDRSHLNNNLKKTLTGTGAIIAMNFLNAPEILNTIAWLYTTYNGFKTYRDFQAK